MLGLKDLLFDEVNEGSVSGDVAIMSEGEEEVLSDEEPEVERPKEVDDVPEQEEEEEDKEEEEIPEVKDLHPFERPSIKDINEKFPEFFKTFPSLKDMYFREGEYSRIFPTIDDAKEANENNEAFINIREDVFSGDGSKFISAIKEVDEKGLNRFASNILPSLVKISPDSFWRAANPLVEDVARSMFNKGVKEKNEDLQNAARYLSEYFFGDVAFAEGNKTSVVKITADPDVAKERESFENDKQTTFRNSVTISIKTDIINQIEGKDSKTGKSKLDPDGVLSNFIKTTIIDSIIRDLDSQLGADKDHIKFMDSLWAKAKRNGRTDEDKTRIVSAYLVRAKSLIPSLRSKYVSEAMGTKARVSKGAKEKIDVVNSRKDSGASGKSSSNGNKGYSPKSINYDKTSDLDILNDNITYK